MTQNEQWIKCAKPEVGDILRWKEPLWAAPNKPRGKPDQIGEQMVSAEMTSEGELLEFVVRSAEKLSGTAEAVTKIKPGDLIRRKSTSIAKGDCQKLLQE